MQIKCPEIISALNFLKDSGNKVLEAAEGWTNIDLDIRLTEPLTASMRNQIATEFPNLTYWEYKGSPHNQAGEGFVCKKHKISLTFPNR